MITLMDFRDKLVSAFSESLTAIIPDMKDRELFPSEAFLLALAELFDLTVSLDTMKNFKGSMTNDLSMYKRYNLLRQFKKYADKRSVRPRAYGTPKA